MNHQSRRMFDQRRVGRIDAAKRRSQTLHHGQRITATGRGIATCINTEGPNHGSVMRNSCYSNRYHWNCYWANSATNQGRLNRGTSKDSGVAAKDSGVAVLVTGLFLGCAHRRLLLGCTRCSLACKTNINRSRKVIYGNPFKERMNNAMNERTNERNGTNGTNKRWNELCTYDEIEFLKSRDRGLPEKRRTGTVDRKRDEPRKLT